MRFLKTALICLLATSAPALADEPRLIGSLGQQASVGSTEAYLRYVGSPVFWKLQPVLGMSLAANGSGWVGAGSAVTWRGLESGLFLRTSVMAGVYRRGAGRDLGGPVQFRSALEVGMQQRSGMEYGLGLDHRSSAGFYKPNPGLNTAYVFASYPLRKKF